MARKKAVTQKKKSTARTATTRKKSTAKKTTARRKATTSRKKAVTKKKTATRKAAAKKKTTAAKKTATKKKPAKAVKKKASGGRKVKGAKLGRSRIPKDAPLDLVFQRDLEARQSFEYLGIRTIRELEEFGPDELIRRLTSPAKQTVGRIRKALAMNNRCLSGDDRFALDFQQKLQSGR